MSALQGFSMMVRLQLMIFYFNFLMNRLQRAMQNVWIAGQKYENKQCTVNLGVMPAPVIRTLSAT
jgi:hypothetical protein